jgi:hypothetical protein
MSIGELSMDAYRLFYAPKGANDNYYDYGMKAA